MLLAGDIGGTKTLLAIYDPAGEGSGKLIEQRFASEAFASLEAIVDTFLRRLDYPVTHAVFGVAGPVVNGVAATTNLPWVIDEKRLAQAFNWQAARLINDLEAVALAVPHLTETDLEVLNPGRAASRGTIGVIAPGTGLGEAFMVWDGSRYQAYPSEGGHTDFGPRNELEWGLLRYIAEHGGKGHVSYEHICAGIGIPNIYNYLRHTGQWEEPAWLAEALAEVEDPTPTIVGAAIRPDDPVSLCQKTLDIFLSVLGAEAGNLALKLLATGGIYVGGGIPPRILPQMRDGRFMASFTDKGRFRRLLEAIPVRVILNREAALLGASRYGLRLLGEGAE